MKKTTLFLFIFLSTLAISAQSVAKSYYGHWLLQSYAQNLLKTKSAYTAQTRAAEVTEFIFAEAIGDSVMICFNNIEGGRFPVTVYPNHLEFATFEGGNKYRVELNTQGNEPKLVLTAPDGSKEVYMFFEGQELEFDAVQRWVNAHVLSDSYAPEIENGARMRGLNDNAVSFKPDGELLGVPGFDSYEVVTRFDEVVNFDVIKFINSRTGHEEFKAWQIRKNKLYIYNLEENTEDYGYKKGKLFLKLDKQKIGS